jgi:sugar/nucleoside kinase (ribokinase family)
MADRTPVQLTSRAERAALDVVGIGFPLVDVLAVVSDHHLDALGLVKGSMTLIDHPTSEQVFATLEAPIEVSGGSAANTLAGIASLGGSAGFIGRIADDAAGHRFAAVIAEAGIAFEPVFVPVDRDGAGEPDGTGRCLVLVTSDAERTMLTHLGSGAHLTPDHIDETFVARGQILYVEGYQYDLPDAKAAIAKAIEAAHDAGRSVAISLSDSFCVERHRADFLHLVEGEIELLFGNRDEVLALFDTEDFDEALSALEDAGVLAAVTCGAEGSILVTASGRISVPAHPVERVVETTGAGDLYAAGFLYGISVGLDLDECGRLGSLCAAEVIAHMGARPEADLELLAIDAGLL